METPGLLRGSKYADDVPLIVDRFDKKTKLRFVDSTEPQFVKFGRIGDRDPKLNIKAGQLKLLGWVQCQHPLFFPHMLTENQIRSREVLSAFCGCHLEDN